MRFQPLDRQPLDRRGKVSSVRKYDALVLFVLAICLSLAAIALRQAHEDEQAANCLRAHSSTETDGGGRNSQRTPVVIPQIKSVSSQEARGCDKDQQDEGWGVTTNTMLVIVGFLQFLGLLGGIWVYCKQAKLMSGQLEAATVTAKAAIKQSTVAEKALTVLECPYIVMSELSRIELEYAYGTTAQGTFMTVTICNVGKTPAFIDEFRACPQVASGGQEPSLRLKTDNRHPILKSPAIASSERRNAVRVDIPNDIEFVAQPGRAVPRLEEGESFYCLIFIGYNDVFGDRHSSSACWVLNKLTAEFEQYGQDRYNYVRRIATNTE